MEELEYFVTEYYTRRFYTEINIKNIKNNSASRTASTRLDMVQKYL